MGIKFFKILKIHTGGEDGGGGECAPPLVSQVPDMVWSWNFYYRYLVWNNDYCGYNDYCGCPWLGHMTVM